MLNVDTLAHSPTLCNKILQELNIYGIHQYNSTEQA